MKTKQIIIIFTLLLIAGKTYGQACTISGLTASSSMCKGGSVNLSVTGSGGTGPYTYQWQYSADGSTLWANVVTGTPTGITYSGGNTSSLTITGSGSEAAGNMYYTCIVQATTGCGPTTSSVATVTVDPTITASVSIGASANPVCAGTSVTFTAIPTNGGTPSYQWKVNTLPVGTNSNTYSYTPLTGDVVIVEMTSTASPCLAGSPATSNSITMTVNPTITASVSIGASANPVCAGTSVTFTATPTNGGTPSYQWKVNTLPVGTNSNTYSYTPLTGDVVIVEMTSTATPCLAGSPATSNTISMTVNPILTAGVSIGASSNPSCAGSPVTFTATPVNGGSTPAYQWKVNDVDAGTNSNTFIYTPVTGDVIKVVMTSNATPCLTNSPVTSGGITMTVNALPVPTLSSNATGNKICAGASVTFTAGGAGGGTYQFFKNGVSQGAPSATNTYTTSTLTDGQVVTVTVVDGNNCTAAHIGITTTVYAYPAITDMTASAGTGEPYTIIPVNGTNGTVPSGTTYSWVTGTFNPDLTIVSGATGTDQSSISGTITNSKSSSKKGNFTVTPKNVQCSGSTFNLEMTILPGATIADKTAAICNGGTFSVTPVDGTDIVPTGTTYSWPKPTAPGISGLAAGAAGSTSISGTLTNSTSAPINVVYTVTPKSGTVTGATFTVTVTVRPTATVNVPANQVKCSGSTSNAVTFSGVANLYSWTNSNTAIGLAASGTGDISSFTTTNAGITSISGTISVIPSYDGCPGTPQNFTITVDPLPTLSGVSQNAQICSGSKATIRLTGLIGSSIAVTYKIGTNSSVTKTGITVSGGIANFLTDDLDAVNNGKTLTIESITNENTGCSATFSQSTLLIVNTATIPTLSGDLTPCINSTEVYTTQSGMNTNSYVWTFSGGEIPTGGGINDNTITVTWTSISTKTISVNFTNSSGCTAASATTISPVVSALPTPAISGPASACINSTGNVYSTLAGMLGYDWEITGGTITSGGDNSSFAVVTWTSDGARSITVNYTNASGCAAASPTVYNVTVHPLPVVTTLGTASTCSGTSPNIALTASVASSFTWTVGTISGSISGATSGSGSTINQVLGNASNSAAGTVEYLVTPTSTTGSCAGSSYSIVVTVLPLPVVTNSAAATICSGTGPNITLTSSVPGSFTWTVGTNPGSITGASAGFGNNINQVLTNPSNSTAGTLQYLIIPTSTTGTCVGNTYSIVVTVNPTPVVTTAATVSTCSGTAPNILLTASTQSTFTWTVGSVTGSISGSSAGSGSTISQVLSNPSNTVVGTVEYLVTPVSITGSCSGVPYSIIVTVNPLPLPGLAGPLTARITSTGNLYSAEAGMNSYIWTVSSGGSVTAGGTSGSNSVTVSWNTTGTQNVSVKYTNTNNCTALAPTSVSVTVNPLPSVSSVAISGTPAIGSTLTGGYTYSDVGGILSNISTFKWFRDGTEISGEVLNTYLLTGADQNKSITFEVTPKTSAGFPNTGTPVLSSATIPVENLSEIPVADQVCIEGVRTAGNILKGKYRYTHSKPEGLSTYKWYLDGVAIPSATGTQYTLLASDIDNDEDITFEVTPVSSNVVPVTGAPASSNPMAKMPLVPTDYSVAVSAVPLTASPTGGIFSGPGVTNGIFSPSTVGIGGSPYSIQYLLNIVNSSTSCSQSVWKAVNVVTNTTEFSSFKDVYCQTEDPDEIVITGLLTGLTSLGFTHTDADAIVGSTAWTVTVDPRKMRPGNNKDYLNFRYKDSRGIVYQISKSFVVDSVGTGLQIINLGNEYCAETPKVNISVTGTYPSGGTGAWTSSLLSDLAATSASVNVALVPAGPTYPLSYQYTSPLGCKSIVINKSVTVNPLPNPSFTIAPFYNIDGGAANLVPVQSPGTFSGNGVSGDKLYPDIAGLGEHTINYRITDTKGCVDDLNIKTTVKTAQGTFTDIPAIICYRDTTFNVKVTGLPSGMTVNSFVNTRNSIDHIVGATDANYSVKAAGHGLDTLTLSYKLDNVDYWISKVVNIDSLGVVLIQNLFAGDKVCDNRAPFELFTSMPGGVFTGPVAGNYLDPTKATGATSVLYKYTNSRTGCSTSTTVPFSIIPAPQVAFVPKDVCIESNRDSTYFLNTTVSSDPVFEWTWTFAEVGAAPSNRKEPAFLYKTGGIHAVSLNVRTVSGCNVTKTSNVDLGIRPIADFTWKNDCFAAGAKLNLSDATFTNFPVISRTWNFNNGSLISSDLNPEYAMQDTGYVQVKYIVRTSYANCADTVSRKIYLRPTITIPKDGFYYQNFEAGKAGWGKDDSDPNLIWRFGTPDRTKINKAKSGVTAWYTKYESDKQGKIDTTSVISPCFDFTNIQRPMITLQAFKIFEKNRNGAALQYKTEGSDWKYVGTLEDGINWYNSTLINGKPGGDKIGWTTLSEEAADVDYVPSSHALDELKGKKNVKFRLAYGSDGNSLDKEGIAFDDIWIGERTRKVLLEHFTNTFSKKGSEATAFVNKIIKVRDKDVINIQYHTNFPDDDPFYLVNPGDASARIFSYGLSKVPYSLIDGGYSNDLYASLSDYKTAPLDSNDLSRRSLLDSKFSLTITPKVTGGVLTVNCTVTALNAFTSDNLILYLVVTEKEAISDKPAALGEVNFKNVFRKFIPDAGGIDLRKTWTKGESFAIPEKTWVIENIKNNSDIEVIAFVQNSQTKEVYQVASGLLKTGKSVFDNSKLDENAIGTETSLLPEDITFGLYPNPASDKLRIEFSDKLAAETDIRIFDFQGAVKKTFKVASGESELFIEDIGLKAGIYLVRISSGGVDLGFSKLIITGN